MIGFGGLTNKTTGQTKPQGANKFGYSDWPGLTEYAGLDTWGAEITEEQAMGLPTIARGVQLLAGVVSGLTPNRVRNQQSPTNPAETLEPTTLLNDPDPAWHGRAAWLNAGVRDLVLRGNMFADKRDTDRFGFPLTLPLIPAAGAEWGPSRGNPDLGKLYRFPSPNGHVELEPGDVFHAVVNPRSGKRMGVGILEQFNVELRTMLAIEHAQWVVMKNGRAVGVLNIDADMAEEELREAKQAFLRGMKQDGIAALVKASFDPVSWNATDLGLADAREFSMRLASQITGVPAYLLGVPGDGKVYSNQETEWSNFIRVSVNTYTQAVEAAWSRCFPRGTTINFNDDELKRPEAKTRWEIYKIAVELDAMTLTEVREAERLGPRLGAPA